MSLGWVLSRWGSSLCTQDEYSKTRFGRLRCNVLRDVSWNVNLLRREENKFSYFQQKLKSLYSNRKFQTFKTHTSFSHLPTSVPFYITVKSHYKLSTFNNRVSLGTIFVETRHRPAQVRPKAEQKFLTTPTEALQLTMDERIGELQLICLYDLDGHVGVWGFEKLTSDDDDDGRLVAGIGWVMSFWSGTSWLLQRPWERVRASIAWVNVIQYSNQ